MLLTDFDTGVKFNFDASIFGSVYNRGLYREDRTTTFDFYDRSEVYRVKEQVSDIIRMATAEREGKENE